MIGPASLSTPTMTTSKMTLGEKRRQLFARPERVNFRNITAPTVQSSNRTLGDSKITKLDAELQEQDISDEKITERLDEQERESYELEQEQVDIARQLVVVEESDQQLREEINRALITRQVLDKKSQRYDRYIIIVMIVMVALAIFGLLKGKLLGACLAMGNALFCGVGLYLTRSPIKDRTNSK